MKRGTVCNDVSRSVPSSSSNASASPSERSGSSVVIEPGAALRTSPWRIIVSAVAVGFHIVLSACALSRTRVPVAFASPTALALVSVACVSLPIRLLHLSRERSPRARAALLGLSLVTLLAFPKRFGLDMRPSWRFGDEPIDTFGWGPFWWSGIYQIVCFVLSFALFATWFYRVWGEDVPKVVWGLVLPPLFFTLMWFFYPQSTRHDLFLFGGVAAAMAIGTLLWARSTE